MKPLSVVPGAVEKFLSACKAKGFVAASESASSWLDEVLAICEDGSIGCIPLGVPAEGIGPNGPVIGPTFPDLGSVKLTIFARGEAGEVGSDPNVPDFLCVEAPMVGDLGTWRLALGSLGITMLTGRHYVAAILCGLVPSETEPELDPPPCFRFVVLKA